MNPYQRGELTLEVDPQGEIDCWVENLDSTLAAEGPEWSDQGAWDLLANWAKLHRAREELLDERAQTIFQNAKQVIWARGAQLAKKAQQRMSPQAWKAWEENLLDLDEHFADLPQLVQSQQAEQLISQLDDAHMVFYMAKRTQALEERAQESWEEHLSRWESLLADHPWITTAAAGFVQAVAATLRPSIPEEDYELAWACMLWENLLDQLVEAKAELEFETPALKRKVQEILGPAKEPSWGVSPMPLLNQAGDGFRVGAVLPLALAAGKVAQKPLVLQWQSPDGKYQAQTIISGAPESVRIEFFKPPEGQPARELAHKPVQLGRISTTITPDARASFSVAQLQEAQEDLRLKVQGQLWLPQKE